MGILNKIKLVQKKITAKTLTASEEKGLAAVWDSSYWGHLERERKVTRVTPTVGRAKPGHLLEDTVILLPSSERVVFLIHLELNVSGHLETSHVKRGTECPN